ncbi:Shedu anti-phage system protein SduA domain-containing protein [Streptomyces sp. NPDC093223]|uniref:Shedu anti-phage system protein SduA domain-containing protein n=1 Tax=Streptomyces sp. NPDC093223 TaxID=3366033 RepID=UPI003828B7B3
MNDYVEYARYVTAEMTRNGYPKLCIAQGDVDEATIAAFESELEAATDERPLQHFFEDHPGILAGELGAHCRWVLPQVSLGGRYVPDFLDARLDSGGMHWTLIELESPTAQLFTRDGQPRRELRKGLSQVQDWRDWLTANRDLARRSRADKGLGLLGIDHLASGIVIIGRRSHRSVADQERLKSLIFRERVLIRSYDWILERARSRVALRGELARGRAVMCEECALPGRTFQ